jgi:superfamily II DNA/RNA helicase
MRLEKQTNKHDMIDISLRFFFLFLRIFFNLSLLCVCSLVSATHLPEIMAIIIEHCGRKKCCRTKFSSSSREPPSLYHRFIIFHSLRSAQKWIKICEVCEKNLHTKVIVTQLNSNSGRYVFFWKIFQWNLSQN